MYFLLKKVHKTIYLKDKNYKKKQIYFSLLLYLHNRAILFLNHVILYLRLKFESISFSQR